MEDLGQAWEREAERWVDWARAPGHDSYWRFHRDAFLGLVPSPGRLTLDMGCGEGRLSRDLAALGHRVLGLDRSPTMARSAAAAAGAGGSLTVVADAARLPIADGAADLAVAFMSLHDMDDMEGAVAEAARALEPGSRFCVAVVHPMNSGGRVEAGARLVLREDYFALRRYADSVERNGHGVTFHSLHRPLQDYAHALAEAGFSIETINEPRPGDGGAWDRFPLFLHVRARLTGRR